MFIFKEDLMGRIRLYTAVQAGNSLHKVTGINLEDANGQNRNARLCYRDLVGDIIQRDYDGNGSNEDYLFGQVLNVDPVANNVPQTADIQWDNNFQMFTINNSVKAYS